MRRIFCSQLCLLVPAELSQASGRSSWAELSPIYWHRYLLLATSQSILPGNVLDLMFLVKHPKPPASSNMCELIIHPSRASVVRISVLDTSIVVLQALLLQTQHKSPDLLHQQTCHELDPKQPCLQMAVLLTCYLPWCWSSCCSHCLYTAPLPIFLSRQTAPSSGCSGRFADLLYGWWPASRHKLHCNDDNLKYMSSS